MIGLQIMPIGKLFQERRMREMCLVDQEKANKSSTVEIHRNNTYDNHSGAQSVYSVHTVDFLVEIEKMGHFVSILLILFSLLQNPI